MIEVVRAGMLTTVQDAGRYGSAHLGVPRSGAADMRSFALANRLVGNDANAAALEVTFGGAIIRFTEPTLFALTGAMTPASLGGRAVWAGSVLRGRANEVLELGAPAFGLRSYIAFSGGLDVRPVLGSRATDTLSGLGPAPLAPGDVLRTGTGSPAPTTPDVIPAPIPVVGQVELRYSLGPRHDWFAPETIENFERATWRVTSETNRVGARLSGPPVAPFRTDQLPSEGMMLGSIEVPPSGFPIVFMADHPTTGGYPVLGVVSEHSLPWLAQSPPGVEVRFVRQRARDTHRRSRMRA